MPAKLTGIVLELDVDDRGLGDVVIDVEELPDLRQRPLGLAEPELSAPVGIRNPLVDLHDAALHGLGLAAERRPTHF